MLKCVHVDHIDHKNIPDYSGPDSVYYFHEDCSDVMYMLFMDSKGNYYPLSPLVDQYGYNITLQQWEERRKKTSADF